MHGGTVLLALVVLLGIVARSPLTSVGAAAILLLQLMSGQTWLNWIEHRGVEIGLLFLTLAMLAPFATGKIAGADVLAAMKSWPGIIALTGGVIATHLNKQGIELLSGDPQLIIGMIVGSLLGIVFFGGIPVGPLMAGGLTALFLQLYSWLTRG
ncbi:DUF441 domain-containing protein [Heliophilum fasciatum]|nr:DUF441 domain-containing protein [Heliophilum fasciatum]MCW2278249.1 uncharacterized membrane protein (DUF441 family) [Heliophilum fasciatum]